MRVVIAIFLMTQSALTHADGTFEINQLCVAGGCFNGDSPGYPIEITQSGSYRLTSNLDVPADVDGVQINADDVNVDLQGHTIAGPVSCVATNPVTCSGGTTGSGIRSGFQTRRHTVQDGTVAGFASDCVRFPAVEGFHLTNLLISNCGSSGIDSNGTGSIERATVNNVGGYGAFLADRITVRDSVFRRTGLAGIRDGVCRQNLLVENDINGSSIVEACTVDDGTNVCDAGPCP